MLKKKIYSLGLKVVKFC